MRSQTIGFYIKTLKNPIAKNQGLPPLVPAASIFMGSQIFSVIN
jgi:hypothetical protein